MSNELKIEKAVLLYQGGIANVYSVACIIPVAEPRLIYQGDFKTCAAIAQGLGLAGTEVVTMSCNVAGDARLAYKRWVPGREDCPFREDAPARYYRCGKFDHDRMDVLEAV